MRLTKKVKIGKLVAPLWAVGLTGAALAAVAGTAVGPVLSGAVSGGVGATISQTVVLSGFPEVGSFNGGEFAATVTGPDDQIGVASDDGTSFTVAIETQVGQSQTIRLPIENNSGQTANAVMELIVPAGIDVEVGSTSGVSEAQLSADKWLLAVTGTNTATDPATGPAGDGSEVDTEGYIYILVEPKDDLKPGFYTISGRLVQVAG